MNIRQKLLSTDGGKSMFEIEAEVVVDNMPNFSQIHGLCIANIYTLPLSACINNVLLLPDLLL